MSKITLGRGRGRGRGLAFKTPPSDIKPGNIASSTTESVPPESKSTVNGSSNENSQTKTTNEVQCVENIFHMMSLMSEEDVLQNIPGQFKYFKTEEGFNAFMNNLMQKCFREPDFSTTAAKLCNKLWNEPNIHPIFKKPLLSTAKQNYKDRVELRKKRKDSFYGLSIFLCEIYKHIKSKGQRLSPLLPFVCQILKEMVGSGAEETTSDDALYFYQEMESIGKIIEDASKHELNEIMNTVRLKIISGDVKPSVRCRLIQLIELAANNWSLRDEVNGYYEDLQQDLIVAGT